MSNRFIFQMCWLRLFFYSKIGLNVSWFCVQLGEFPMDCPLQDSQLRVHYKGMLLNDEKTVFYDTKVNNDGQPLEFRSGEGLVSQFTSSCMLKVWLIYFMFCTSIKKYLDVLDWIFFFLFLALFLCVVCGCDINWYNLV